MYSISRVLKTIRLIASSTHDMREEDADHFLKGPRMRKTILLVLGIALSATSEKANADFTFGEPVNLGSPINTASNEATFCLSADGLEMYISSNRPGTYGIGDIWVSTRPTINDDWAEPVNLGPIVNSQFPDTVEYISPDGLELYFDALNRPGGKGGWDIWRTVRTTKNEPWAVPTNLGIAFNTYAHDWKPCISSDNLKFYFTSMRPGGYGGSDIWVANRVTMEEPWAEPVNLGPLVNSSADDSGEFISGDGLALFFHSMRPGGSGGHDMWMTNRRTIDDDWNIPVNLGPRVNTASDDIMPNISADGSILYFCSPRPGGQGAWDIYQAPIMPVVDLSGDGFVDANDMSIMVDHWGEDYSLCDIAPSPFGDGIVDIKDLTVLAEHLFEAFPPVVPLDVNETDDGGQVELVLGQTLVVTLESNPTTGYRWEQVADSVSILKQMGEAEFKPSQTGEPPLVGAGGWEIFSFRAVHTGQMNLQLVYHRPWEGRAETLQTFTLQVTVP